MINVILQVMMSFTCPNCSRRIMPLGTLFDRNAACSQCIYCVWRQKLKEKAFNFKFLPHIYDFCCSIIRIIAQSKIRKKEFHYNIQNDSHFR